MNICILQMVMVSLLRKFLGRSHCFPEAKANLTLCDKEFESEKLSFLFVFPLDLCVLLLLLLNRKVFMSSFFDMCLPLGV